MWDLRISLSMYPCLWNDAKPFPFSCCPLRLDFHYAVFSVRVLPKAAPSPLIGLFYQSAPHRIAMNVSYLLYKLFASTR